MSWSNIHTHIRLKRAMGPHIWAPPLESGVRPVPLKNKHQQTDRGRKFLKIIGRGAGAGGYPGNAAPDAPNAPEVGPQGAGGRPGESRRGTGPGAGRARSARGAPPHRIRGTVDRSPGSRWGRVFGAFRALARNSQRSIRIERLTRAAEPGIKISAGAPLSTAPGRASPSIERTDGWGK